MTKAPPTTWGSSIVGFGSYHDSPGLDIAEADTQDRLKSLRQYFDTGNLLQQLGLMAQPAAAARS